MGMNLKQYLWRVVEVIGKNGVVYRGLVDVYTAAKDNDIPEASISSDSGWWLYEHDIKSIRIVEEPS